MASGGVALAGLQSSTLNRATMVNRETQRLLTVQSSHLGHSQHRARCDINSQIQELKADLFRIRIRTPTLSDSLDGKSLAGVDEALQRDAATVSDFYEIGANGKLMRRRKRGAGVAGSRYSNGSGGGGGGAAGKGRGKSKRMETNPTRRAEKGDITVTSPEELQSKVTDFFERSSDLLSQDDNDDCLTFLSDTEGHDISRRSSLLLSPASYKKLRLYGEVKDQSSKPPRQGKYQSGGKVSQESSAAPRAGGAGRRGVATTTASISAAIESAWRSPLTNANPYQALFKPEHSTLRLAHQVALVSRKLHQLDVSRAAGGASLKTPDRTSRSVNLPNIVVSEAS